MSSKELTDENLVLLLSHIKGYIDEPDEVLRAEVSLLKELVGTATTLAEQVQTAQGVPN
jgi:hypothetical protein